VIRGIPGAAAAATLLAVPAMVMAVPSDTVGRLHDLFAREWEWRLVENPFLGTQTGDHRYDDRLPSVDARDEARRAEETRKFLAELRAIDRAALPFEEQVSHDIFASQLDERIRSFEFGEYQMPINADSGFHSGFAQYPQDAPRATRADYGNYLARLRAFPLYMQQNIANMRAGLERGWTVPQVTLKGVEGTIMVHLVRNPEESVFWGPFRSMPAGMPAEAQQQLRAQGRAVIQDAVIPAYTSFLEFMTREYIPGARTTLGASELPKGKEYYQWQLRNYTTLDMTAEQVHKIGLEQVEGIQKEMQEIIRQTAFEGSFADFLKFLRTDPRFYPKTADELLMKASYIAKRMDGRLPALFKTMPRMPYTVAPVPEHLAPKYTAGRANGAPFGGTRAGEYWVNTYALDTRPLYNLEALTLHEAAPGHLFQGALAEEQENLPRFRRFSYISTYGEGWGLYSEWLGLEAGFYTDPYSNFGRLTYAMWRACRLVVDTGIHAFGWDRQRVIDYMAQRTALSLHEVTTETDRYISWPGQAVSYKIGELKIRELRRKAEAALGERFDVRTFHDAVLLNGSVPLPVLEQAIDRYIAAAKAAPAS